MECEIEMDFDGREEQGKMVSVQESPPLNNSEEAPIDAPYNDKPQNSIVHQSVTSVRNNETEENTQGIAENIKVKETSPTMKSLHTRLQPSPLTSPTLMKTQSNGSNQEAKPKVEKESPTKLKSSSPK